MPPSTWLATLLAAALAQEPAAGEPGEVWLDVAPAQLVAVAAGDIHSAWPGEELAALDDAGRLHLVARADGRTRVLSCDLPVSQPALLVLTDLDRSLAQGEVYALGARGDLWQALPLSWSGELRTKRIGARLPLDARAIVSGRFQTHAFGRELLVLEGSGTSELMRIDHDGELRRRPVEVPLPLSTGVMLVDRDIERAIVFGIGRCDGLLLVGEDGGLWGFTELKPDTERERFADGAGRLLGRARPSPPTRLDSHLFDQSAAGDVRALVWRGDPRRARWETVAPGLPRVAGLLSAARRSPEGGERLWTLDERGVLRLSTRGPEADDPWTTEVAHDARARGVALVLYDAERKQQDSTAQLVAAWGSRVVDLGAP